MYAQPIHIIVPFWGESYRECFLNLLLPSLLAKGNLPNWPYLSQTTFVIYTTAEDFKHLLYVRELQCLSQLLAIEHRPIDAEHAPANLKYDRLSLIHKNAIHIAHQNQASVMFPMVDVIFADGTLTALAQSIANGAELGMILGLKTNIDQIADLYEGHLAHGALSVTPEQCFDFYRQHINNLAHCSFGSSDFVNTSPTYLSEWNGSEQLLMRAFYMHPFFIKHPELFPSSGLTMANIDGDYLQLYYKKRNKMVNLTNKYLFCLSLYESFSPDQCGVRATESEKFQKLLSFAVEICAPIHRWFFRTLLTYHYPTDETGNPNDILPPPELRVPKLLMQELYLALEPTLQIEESFLEQDFAAIVMHYHQHGWRPTRPELAFGGYYVALALYQLGHIVELVQLLRQHQVYFLTPHWAYTPVKPIYLNYLNSEGQDWLNHTALPLSDLEPAPFIWIWAEQTVNALDLKPSATQWLVQLPAKSQDTPLWVEHLAHDYPQQTITVLPEDLEPPTVMLCGHQANLLLITGGPEKKAADALIYRILQNKPCGWITPTGQWIEL